MSYSNAGKACAKRIQTTRRNYAQNPLEQETLPTHVNLARSESGTPNEGSYGLGAILSIVYKEEL